MPATRLRLNSTEIEELGTGAAALGIDLDAESLSKLRAYSDLLDIWHRRVNLIASAGSLDLLERHLLDSLAVGPLLPDTGILVDLGSGAGFPGVPLAIAKPERRTVLVETRRRRANFLRAVKRELQLKNVDVRECRAEDPPETDIERASAVVSRAVWSGVELLGVASGWMEIGGALFWMRSDPLPVPNESQGGLRWERRFSYQIGRSKTRVVEIFRRELFASHDCFT